MKPYETFVLLWVARVGGDEYPILKGRWFIINNPNVFAWSGVSNPIAFQ
jgi:hypothetical protein